MGDETPAIPLGTRMKAEREKQGLSIEDVHNRLRIHQDSLSRIEKNQFRDWPGGNIYVKGFIRQYATFLGMNSAELMAEYDELGLSERKVELEVGPMKTKQVKDQVQSIWEPIKAHRELIIKIAAGIAVLLFAIFVWGLMIRGIGDFFEARKEKAVKSPKVIKQIAAPEPKAVSAAPATTSQPNKAVEAPATPKTSPAVTQTAPQPAAPTVKYINSPAQNNFPIINNQSGLAVIISVNTDVWLRVTSDGKIVYESILKTGEKSNWAANDEMIIKMGRPAGVDMKINGYSIGKPGGGQAKEVRITRHGMESI